MPLAAFDRADLLGLVKLTAQAGNVLAVMGKGVQDAWSIASRIGSGVGLPAEGRPHRSAAR
ncbi:MAG: hypothetical protein M3069_25165 [Chloroflexota bacterium]|nr:hypothetical protein [Chloroflexota bacterium]